MEGRSKTFIGFIKTTEGLSQVEMRIVDLNDYKKANKEVWATMGFKVFWGRTKDGEVIEFFRAKNIRKKDLEYVKSLGVVEAVTHGCFAPKTFDVPEGRTTVKGTIELGKETTELVGRFAKAIYG